MGTNEITERLITEVEVSKFDVYSTSHKEAYDSAFKIDISKK